MERWSLGQPGACHDPELKKWMRSVDDDVGFLAPGTERGSGSLGSLFSAADPGAPLAPKIFFIHAVSRQF